MQLIRNAIEYLLASICKMAEKIRQTTSKVKANKYQCTRLSERVDTIIGFLQ